MNVNTPVATLSFPSLFAPKINRAYPNNPPQFNATFLIPKTQGGFDVSNDPAVAHIYAACHAAGVEKFGTAYNPHGKNMMPVKDGDVMAREKNDPFYAGKWVINASAKAEFPPMVVDANLQQFVDKAEVYAGCQVVGALSPFAYNTVGAGVSLGLRGVKKVGEGKRLDGAVTDPNVLFGGVAGAPAPLVQQPQYAAPAAQAAAAPVARPMFDPMTGQPIAQAAPAARPMFDPMTGQPIAAPVEYNFG